MLVAIIRWVVKGWVEDLVAEYAPQLVMVLVLCLAMLLSTMLWALSIMFNPAGGGIFWLASQASPELRAQHPLLPVAQPTGSFNAALPSVALGPAVGPTPGVALPAPPAAQWPLMQRAAAGQGGCTFDPVWLAAVAFYESAYGANPGPSSAGAWGYGQFMPETLAAYGISRADAVRPEVMLPAMATYLCRAGMATNVDAALFSYNHSAAYVEWVKYLASTWFKSVMPSWVDHAAWNQYATSSWRDPAMYQLWHPAACSAAALAWMLGAYGQSVPYLDDTVRLLGSGISPVKGLEDHRGPALAAALSSRGLSAWDEHLNSTQQLVDKLRIGPVMLDGFKWFGVGHWFVATGSDASGITVRESSGNNVTHLTWEQLYGPVGWDGWAVGVLP